MKIEDIASLEDTEAAPAKREAEMQEASFVGVMRDDAAELVAPSEFDALVPVDVEPVTFIGLDPAPESDAASRAINALLGTADGDVLMTDADHLIAFGLAGDDNMVSTVEGSKLFGGDGGDLMQSEHGGDTLSGGEGVDMFMLWVDAFSAPSKIVDFSADDMLVIIGGGNITRDGSSIMSDGVAVATFRTEAMAKQAAWWVGA
jgi:hypothetical protein